MYRATHECSRFWLAIGLASVGLCAWSSAWATQERDHIVDDALRGAPGRAAWDRLSDGTLSDEERQAAADEVLTQTPLTLDKLAAEIRFPFAGKSGAVYVVRAIERADQPPAALFEMVRARFEIADREELPTLLGAVGAFGTREAARVALRYLTEEGPIGLAAESALVRATGRDDLGSDRREWSIWLDEVQSLNVAQWNAELARRRGAQLQRLAQHERTVVARLLESLRKTHIETPEGERPALLASYLKDPIPEIRELGFSLVTRELGAGATLNGEVSRAAIELLSHPDPRTRASAALLVNQLSPPDAEGRVMDALARETEPLPAGAMLDTAARWASPRLAPLVLTWLTSIEEPSWKPATNALWALSRAGSLTDQQQADALELLRRAKDVELSPSACRFLGAAGEDTDRNRLAKLLESDSSLLRQAVAAALAPYAEYVAAIVHAAGRDEELFPAAARATLLHRPTLEGYRSLHAVAPANPASRREGLLLVAGAIPAPDLFTLASECTSVSERTDLLEDLTSESRVLSERALPENLDAILQGVLDLAHLRLEGDAAESALVLLDQFASLASGATRGKIAELQVAALLVLDRMELAEVLDSPASAWLLGLRLSVHKANANVIASALESRFESSLTPSERDELGRLKAAIDSTPKTPEKTRDDSGLEPKK